MLLLKCETSRFAAGINPANCVQQAIVVERCVAQSKSGLTVANIISTGNTGIILAIANISILANSSACGNCKGVEREEKSQPKVFVKDELFYLSSLLFIYLVREVSV